MKVLIDHREIHEIVSRMALKINEDYKDRELIVIGILKGSIFFLTDLVRQLKVPIEIDFIEAASYEGAEPSGSVKLDRDRLISLNIKNRDVLLVEDILDTGRTLDKIVLELLVLQPRSLRVAVFLGKKAKRVVPVRVEYIGKEIPDEFVVGYGLDYNGKFRNLPDVRIFEKSQL